MRGGRSSRSRPALRRSRLGHRLLEFLREEPALHRAEAEVTSHWAIKGRPQTSLCSAPASRGAYRCRAILNIMYALARAPTNYIASEAIPTPAICQESTVNDLHMVGQGHHPLPLRVQPAFLMSAGVAPPRRVNLWQHAGGPTRAEDLGRLTYHRPPSWWRPTGSTRVGLFAAARCRSATTATMSGAPDRLLNGDPRQCLRQSPPARAVDHRQEFRRQGSGQGAADRQADHTLLRERAKLLGVDRAARSQRTGLLSTLHLDPGSHRRRQSLCRA